MEDTHSDRAWDGSQNESDQESHPPAYRHVYHLVLLCKSRNHVLAEVLENNGGRLPALQLSTSISYTGAYEMLEKNIHEELGVSVHVVREIPNGANREFNRPHAIEVNRLFLGDVLDDHPVVKRRLDWIHRSYASIATWGMTNADEDASHVARVLNQVFEEANGERPLSYPEPWRNAGWYENMTSWSRGILERRNMVLMGRIRQHLIGSMSIVMKCEVRQRVEGAVDAGGSADVIYIKSSLPSLREVQRTVAAAEAVGSIVPEVIGAEYGLGFLMQRNVGSVTDAPFDQHTLVSTVLRMQTLSLKHVRDLENAGLRVRDFRWLEVNLESILNHELLDRFYQRPGGGEDAEDKEQILYVRSKTDMLRKKCRDVINLGLPRTLVHGDWDLRNTGSPAESDGKFYRAFDWAKAFIGNPLHDFDSVLRPSQLDYEDVPIDTDAGLRQVCKHWKLTATIEEMNAALLTASTMSVLVDIHDLMEQYHECDDSRAKEREILLGALKDQIAGLSV